MNVCVIQRPDQPELENPYYAALEGPEFMVVQERYKEEQYPPKIATCYKKEIADALAQLINNCCAKEFGPATATPWISLPIKGMCKMEPNDFGYTLNCVNACAEVEKALK